MGHMRNLWQLMQGQGDRCTLMRTCGVAEDVLADGSDYDKFAAYAACMPLCCGHTVLQENAQLIEGLLGVSVPICPETAPALWHAAAYALTGQGEMPELPVGDAIVFETPANSAMEYVDLGQAFYAMPTPELLMRLVNAQDRGICVTAYISEFVKPNPYAAKQLCQRDAQTLQVQERDLLGAQTLRVLGKICAERGTDLYVQSDFAPTEAWRALLAYLQQSGCLAQIVLVAQDADALRAAASLAGCLPNPTDAPVLRVGVADPALMDLYRTILPVGVMPTLC